MIEYVDNVNEIRAEFDLILSRCDLTDLSAKEIVEEARRIEELITVKI